MKVMVAEVTGMCFGVRDALRAIDAIENPKEVTIHGELVHNEVVLDRLRSRGFPMVDETGRRGMPATPLVLITAHGVSNVERSRLSSAGKQLLDTTCPLVARAHEAALHLQEEGYHVLVIGRPGHVEVQGIVGDLRSFDVVPYPDAVKTYPHRRLGIVCQTTSPARTVQSVRQAIEDRNPGAEIRFIDTVCLPTKEHQRSLERLADQVEAMVVVGGRNSNNTRELAAYCRQRNLPTFHVQGADDLRAEWFRDFRVVGLTAGTSTLDSTIDEVRQALIAINCAQK